MADPIGARHLALASGAVPKDIDMGLIVPKLSATKPAELSPVMFQPIYQPPLRILLPSEGEPVAADFALWSWLGKYNLPTDSAWRWHVQGPTKPMVATRDPGHDTPVLVMMPHQAAGLTRALREVLNRLEAATGYRDERVA